VKCGAENMGNIYIIIHGFAGGFYEIEPLYSYLQSKKFKVHSVILAGHGGTRRELSLFSCDDWIDSAIRQIKIIQKNYRKKVGLNLIGFSMGGLICANLTEFFHVKKIVFINTPVYYWDIKQIAKNIIYDIKHRTFTHIDYYVKSTFKSPPNALVNFMKILQRTKNKFSSSAIKEANPLILQCLDDDTVHNRSANYIKNEIGASAKLKYYSTGGHQVFSSKTSDRICDDVYKYLDN